MAYDEELADRVRALLGLGAARDRVRPGAAAALTCRAASRWTS